MKSYMVFDIGGSEVKYAVMNGDGEFLAKGSCPAEAEDYEAFIAHLVNAVRENRRLFPLSGIAISSPGSVDCETGIIGGSSALPCIHGPSLKERLFHETGLPAEMENDANCAALGEVWKGAAADNKDVLFVVIGSGIGGAIVKDRRIHKGAHLHGGEFGYMVLNSAGPSSAPGFRTWSDLAAVGGIVRQTARIKGENRHDWNGIRLFNAAEAGDPVCREAVEQFYYYMALGLYNLQYMYDPEKIILGGAISNRDHLISDINRRLDSMLSGIIAAKIRPDIEICRFRNDANLLGALYHFLQRQRAREETIA